MELSYYFLVAIGIAFCALAGSQLALSSAGAWRARRLEKKSFDERQSAIRRQLSDRSVSHTIEQIENFGTWRGFRRFTVDRLVKEAENTTSAYLIPSDGKSIPGFRPGQHLTLRLPVPGQSKPVVRCYSLSDGPGKPYYRISVKEVPPPREKPELGFGKASHYINRQLEPGQIIDIKAPAGDFYLNDESDRLVILLAGGVGITPMISMLEHLISSNPNRTAVLLYGIRNGQDHPFKDHLRQRSQSHPYIHVLNCYSNPDPADRQGIDYHVHGFVSTELLKKMLPEPNAEFYLCGPPAFMKSNYDGLIEWGANPDDVHFEAFGPASIVPAQKGTDEALQTPVAIPVQFRKSEVTLNWNGQQSLLELAEANQIPVDSGCRAGSCGSCSVALLRGQVEYPAGVNPACSPGQCLLCIAKPKEPLELDV